MARELRMKSRNKEAIGHVILVMAVCGLAAVGFDYIMETLTARTVGLHRMSGQRAATAAPADH
jgi:hypothetical protein